MNKQQQKATYGFTKDFSTPKEQERELLLRYMKGNPGTGTAAGGMGNPGNAFSSEDGQNTILNMEQEVEALRAEGVQLQDGQELNAAYFTMRALGVSPVAAYKIIESDSRRLTNRVLAPPPRPGRVNNKMAQAKSFYSPEEVDRLTEEDLKNPKVMENVMKSMTKWKN